MKKFAPGDRVYVLVDAAIVQATIQSVLDEEGGWYTLVEVAGEHPRSMLYENESAAKERT